MNPNIMEITLKDPQKLTPYERNNKKHSPEQIQHIANSIEKYGFIQPIVTDKNGIIIIGHARREAAIKLKMKTVPVLEKTDLTEEQTKRLRLLDNRLGDLGEYDIDNVLSEIEDLQDPELKEFFSNLYPTAEEQEEDEETTGGDTETPSQLQDIVIVVTKEQREIIEKALEVAKKISYTDNENHNPNGNALFIIARAFISQ
jgi:hypothetical protein